MPGLGLPYKRLPNKDMCADFFEVPAAYLAKQMQLLRRAGIVESLRGKGGGYRLARSVDDISLLDIVAAIDGPMPAFRCTEIRQNGPCGLKRSDCKKPCERGKPNFQCTILHRPIVPRSSLGGVVCKLIERVGGVIKLQKHYI